MGVTGWGHGGRESPGPAAPLSLLTVIFIGLWVFFPICRWPWQGGQGPARGCAAPEPSGAAWLRREPLCSAGALGGSSAGGGAGRAAGRPATSLQEGRGVERFIYTNLLERTARVSCRDRTQGFFDQTWVCHGGRGLAVSPDRLLFHAAAGGCWAAASHASVSIKYRARTGCRVLCWGRVAPALLRGLRGCLRVRSHPAQAVPGPAGCSWLLAAPGEPLSQAAAVLASYGRLRLLSSPAQLCLPLPLQSSAATSQSPLQNGSWRELT